VAETYTKEQTKIPEIIDTQIGNIQLTQQELSDSMNNKLDRDTNDDNIVMSIPKPNKRKRIVRRPKKGNDYGETTHIIDDDNELKNFFCRQW